MKEKFDINLPQNFAPPQTTGGFSLTLPDLNSIIIRYVLLLIFITLTATAFSQNLPSASSCTSKDLELVSATLPPPAGGDQCSCSGTRTLMLAINNKTGSTRTSFAFWATLEVYDATGKLVSSTPISGCNGPIAANSITSLPYGTISRDCNQTLRLTNLFLAWTDASPKSTCPINPATINPKCGTLPDINILGVVDAGFSVTDATCTSGGTIVVSPFGGKAPYQISIDGSAFTSTTTYNNLSAGNHTFIIKDANGCTSTKTRTINSSSTPIANAGDDFTKTCLLNPDGKQIGETPAVGFSYAWSSAAGLSNSSIANPIANPTVSTTYVVTKTNIATGCKSTDEVQVTVDNAVPTANAGSDVTINCTNTSANLSASGGTSYAWSPAAGLSATNIANPIATPSSTTTYIVTVTGANGCSATDDVKVTVDKTLPIANAGSDVTINCTTTSANLSASGGVSYMWSPAAGLSATNIANPVATPSSTTTYIVTVTGANGCSATDDVKVTVDKTAPTANAGSDVTINCTNTSANLSASGGVSYMWSPAAGLSATNIANPIATPSATTTYIVTVTGANGCTATDDVKVTVDKILPVANAGSDVTINCTTTSANLSTSGGVSYMWSPAAGLSATNIANPVATPAATTTYIVIVTGANGCTATDDVKVTVDKTVPIANAGSDVTINCSTTSANLSASGSVSYAWSPAAGLSATNIANPVATPSATTTYIVTVTGTNGCTATDDVKVTVDKTLPVANAGSDVIINCTTASANLSASGGVSYAWSPASGLSATNIANPVATPSATTTYIVTVTGANGCTATDDVTVSVATTPPPAPAICVVQPSLCGPSTGSITILSPLGSDYLYSIDNGTTWQASASFNNLAAGSVTGIKVKSISSGCISSGVSCDASACETQAPAIVSSASSATSQSLTLVTKQQQTQTKKIAVDFGSPEDEPTVKAFPNPFTDRVKFVITSPVSGTGSLEIYNNLGQKVSTLYSGHINAGTQTFDLNMPTKQSANIMYVLKIGDKRLTGKLMQINK